MPGQGGGDNGSGVHGTGNVTLSDAPKSSIHDPLRNTSTPSRATTGAAVSSSRPGISAEDISNDAKESYISAKDSAQGVWQGKDASSFAKEPHTSVKEPHTSAKDGAKGGWLEKGLAHMFQSDTRRLNQSQVDQLKGKNSQLSARDSMCCEKRTVELTFEKLWQGELENASAPQQHIAIAAVENLLLSQRKLAEDTELALLTNGLERQLESDVTWQVGGGGG